MRRYSILPILLSAALIVFSCGIKTPHYPRGEQNGYFSLEERILITEGSSSTPMRVLKTDNLKDSLELREISRDINPDKKDAILNTLIDRMYATVTDSVSGGVGIAAPQVGIKKRVIWVQRFDKDEDPFELYLNPKILFYSSLRQDCREGCLSVPVIRGNSSKRSYAIVVQYDNFESTGNIEMIEGFTAVIFQHEIDHLNGILFFDYF